MTQQIKWWLTKLPPWCERFMIYVVRIVFYYGFYRGDRFTCPCCGKGSRRFKRINPSRFEANIAAEVEASALCTYCCSLPRQRAICHWITENKIAPQNVILFAPEPCTVWYLRRVGIPFLTSDLFRRGCDLRLDLCDIDLPDGSQDLIICNHILEHVPDDAKAMFELARILSDDGTALIMVPMDLDLETTMEDAADTADMRTEMYGQQDHVRLYGRDFVDKLRAHMSVTVFDGSEIDKCIMPKFGPFSLDINLLYVCTKNITG